MVHRFFARLIGVLYVIPFIFLFLKKQIDKKYNKRVFLIGFFLIIQSVVGWYMVKSGLVGRVDVSQYRLAMHLTLAFVILGITFQILLEANIHRFNYKDSRYSKKSEFLFLFLLFFTFLQISYGAFVSGTHSGLLFNTWPMYEGNILPLIENNTLKGIINIFEKGEYIIFIHRTFAIFLLFLVIYVNFISIRINNTIWQSNLLIIFNIAFIIQILLGVLMTFINIPWHLALAHQGNAIILYLLAISMWMLSKKSSQSNFSRGHL